MPSFKNGDVEIAYLDEGQGEPILLIHGFASNRVVNWVNPGWVATLNAAGRRVIAFDNRGHGESTKLYEPAAYHTDRMGEDAIALLDHLKIERADVLGYSMGARIAAFLAAAQPRRGRSAILGGLGYRLIDGAGLPESIADALEAPSLADVTDPQGRTFRAFADQTRSDRLALAACIRGSRQVMPVSEVAKMNMPVMVAVGSKDDVAGPAEHGGAHRVGQRGEGGRGLGPCSHRRSPNVACGLGLRRPFDRADGREPAQRDLLDSSAGVPAVPIPGGQVTLHHGAVARRSTVRILLVGMMGSGKTTVGRELARRTGWPFLDNDALVRELTGRQPATIDAEDGEDALHAAETAAFRAAVARLGPAIIAVAGAVADEPEERAGLAAAGHVVWLRANPATLLQRVGSGAGRRADARDPEWVAARVVAREPAYGAVADQVIDVDGRTPGEVVAAILDAVGLPSAG